MHLLAADASRVRRRGPLQGVPPALFSGAALAALLVLLPIIVTAYAAARFGWREAIALVWRPLVGELLLNTLAITIATTVLCVVLGVALAWFVERTDLRGSRIWSALAVAPLAMPAFIASYAWVSLSADLQDFNGALLVISSASFPLVFLPVAAALRGMDPALEETARSLGCSRVGVFVRVILPQLRPALLGGSLLVALSTISEFGAFTLLRFRTFTTQVYAEFRTTFDSGGASVFGCILIVLCLLCFLLERRLMGQSRYDRIERGTRRPALRYALGRWSWPVLAGCTLVAVISLGVPIGMILYWLVQSAMGISAAATPAEVSINMLLSTTWASLSYGAVAAVVTTALCTPLAFLLVRYPSRIASLLDRAVLLAQGVPSLIIGLAIVALAIRWLPFLYQSAVMLILAYAILALPFALVSVRAALAQVSPRLEENARALGAGRTRTFLRIVMPLIAPGLGASATMVFITVVTELNATLLLSPIGTETLATEVWADTSTLAFAGAAPYAALMLFMSMGGSAVLFIILGRAGVRAR